MSDTAAFLAFVAVMVVLVGVPVLLFCFKKCREHPIEAIALYAGTVLVAVILGVNVHDRSMGQDVVIDTPTGPESPLFTATAEELKHTTITPVLTDGVPDSTNVIYCASFQLAWDKLRHDYVHEPVRLFGNPPFVDGLNNGRFTRNDIADSACLVMAGRYPGIIQQIDAEMRRKFNTPMPNIDIPQQDARGNSPDLIVYAYLEKQLSYAHPFEHIEAGINFGGTLVAAFGQLKTKNIFEQQAKIYQDTAGIAVELIPEGDDRIYLVKMPRPATLQAGWERLQQLLAGSRYTKKLGQDETLRIPKMNFDFLRTYEEFAGRGFANRTMREFYISRALQNIRFRLDERGAVLKSYSSMDIRSGIGLRMDLIFDQPFLLCLKEKDAANPYFVMWVDNPEVLVRQNELLP